MHYANLVYVHTLINIIDNPDLMRRFKVLFGPLIAEYFDFNDETWDLMEEDLFRIHSFERFLMGPIDASSLNYYCSCVLSCSYKEDKTHFKHLMKQSHVSQLLKKVEKLNTSLHESRAENQFLKESNKKIRADNVMIQKRNLILNDDIIKLRKLIAYI